MTSSFLLFPVAAALLASLAGGLVGSYVVVRRLSNLCGSITHSVLGGMGLCLWLQRCHNMTFCHPLLGAFFAAIASAWVIGWMQLRFRQRVDAIIAAIWSTGMAIGVIFLALTPGSTGDLSNFLLGNLLWVSQTDLLCLGILSAFVLGSVFYCYRPFLAICFDEEQALLQGIAPQRIYLFLLTLVALTIVLLSQIVGTILTIALLTLPAMTANLFVKRFATLMKIAVCISLGASCLGVFASYAFNWPPGAAISLCAAVIYALAVWISP